mmetsp:Transcript_17578/g.44784  ORF Transcript_17578/g.44784 Transcript_17578/m.44784 type:complete len:355 (+) Transcript_17578:1310-2374(+)
MWAAKHEKLPFTSAQIEFMSEDTSISVTPLFKESMLTFVGGNYGPFRPGLTTDVPLWLALALKKNQKCNILTPHWLSVDYLQTKLEMEREEDTYLCEMPYHYLEIATQLLHHASDDVRQPDRVQVLIDDLYRIRSAKIRKSIQTMENDDPVQLTNYCAMELNYQRMWLLKAFDQMHALSVAQPSLLPPPPRPTAPVVRSSAPRLTDTPQPSSPSLRSMHGSRSMDTHSFSSSNILDSSSTVISSSSSSATPSSSTQPLYAAAEASSLIAFPPVSGDSLIAFPPGRAEDSLIAFPVSSSPQLPSKRPSEQAASTTEEHAPQRKKPSSTSATSTTSISTTSTTTDPDLSTANTQEH